MVDKDVTESMGLEPLVRGMYFIKNGGQKVTAGVWAVDQTNPAQERRYIFLGDDGNRFLAGPVGQSGGFRPHIQQVGLQISRLYGVGEVGFRLI